jgi:hypothetical protein
MKADCWQYELANPDNFEPAHPLAQVPRAGELVDPSCRMLGCSGIWKRGGNVNFEHGWSFDLIRDAQDYGGKA